MSTATQSLDDRYLVFRKATALAFARFPQTEPMRHLIFKELWVGQRGAQATDWLKHLWRRYRHRTRHTGPLDKADVLLWIDGQRDVIQGAVLPVWEACRQRGIKAQLVAAGGAANLPAETHRIEGTETWAVPDWAGPAWQILTTALPDLNRASLRRTFRIASAATSGRLQLAREILATVDPRIVVVASNNIAGGTALTTRARLEGRTTVLLQHGVPQAFYTPVNEDVMLTWGESSNRILSGLQVPSAKLCITGSPRHDGMKPSAGGRLHLCRALGLPDQPTFVFFSNGNDLVRNGCAPAESAVWLEAAAVAFPQANVIVRLHPNEDGSLYRQAPHVRVTKHEVDLETTLSGADAVASLCSTVMYDALLFARPVWQFFAPHWPALADNWEQGLADRISSEVELKDKLRGWLDGETNGSRWERAAEQVFANRGNAAAAVAEQIQGLLRGASSTASPLAVAAS